MRSDWSCRRCHGKGIFYDEKRKAMVLCDCPSAESKRRWLESTPEERSAARRKPGRSKSRGKNEEKIPF